MNRSADRRSLRTSILVAAFAVTAAGAAHATSCGSGIYPFPYTDVAGVGDAFCPGILEAYVLGVTRGTTATTFSPNDNVSRTQMTTFLKRSIDQGLRRANRRSALGQWWTPNVSSEGLERIALPGAGPVGSCKSDGERIWVANGNRFQSVQASTGEVLADAFFGPSIANLSGVLVANARVYMVDPIAQFIVPIRSKLDTPFLSSATGNTTSFHPANLTYDGWKIWTANSADGSLNLIPLVAGALATPGVVVGGFTSPVDVVYDGSNVWVAEAGAANRIRKLAPVTGAPLLSVPVGSNPSSITYDGANLWVTNVDSDSITVVSASTGAIVATIVSNFDNGLSAPRQAAFDGERILVTNRGNDSVTLFRAADLSVISQLPLDPGSDPYGACSDGINFWVTLRGSKELLRL